MDVIANATELDRRLGIPGVARVSEGNDEMPRVQVAGRFGEGVMHLHGAQVTSWKPAGHDEVLFVSSESHWLEGQAIRGGIPICFPWFRAKLDDPHAPAHGFVRTKAWRLQSIAEGAAGVSVSMFTESDDATRHWWPAEFRLVYRVTFGSALKLELACTNTGMVPLRFEEALHTYNRVADVQEARLLGLENLRFLDNTDSNRETTQFGEVALASQTDNVFLNTQNTVDLLDAKMQRRLRLKKSNSLTTVVWNPWREGAAGMKDLGDDEWTQFLCVEASNILGAAIDLEPGAEHKMVAVLSVEKL